jgi:hypothetical protein
MIFRTCLARLVKSLLKNISYFSGRKKSSITDHAILRAKVNQLHLMISINSQRKKCLK